MVIVICHWFFALQGGKERGLSSKGILQFMLILDPVKGNKNGHISF
jgi:hypothetical protein